MKRLEELQTSLPGPSDLARNYVKAKHLIRYARTPRQKELIHDLVKSDEFVLVVLDSCRFDVFSEEVDDFLSGDLQAAYTPATYTIDYIQTVWDGTHDLTYVSALSAPTDYAFERKDLDFRPSEHIDNFVHVWQLSEEKELGAVTPEEMTRVALKQNDSRMVVHYVQPHAPYIGDYRLRESEDQTFAESLDEIYEKIGWYDEQEKTISDRELKRAYRSNLRRALAAVEELVRKVDRPVVVTADHGELLGEGGRYIHGGRRHPRLCEVPWFTVDESMIGTAVTADSQSEDLTESDYTDNDVVEQLRHLGYK